MALVVNPNGTCSINGRFGVLPPIKEYSAYMLYYHDHTGRTVVEGVFGVDGKPVPEGASPEKTLLVKLMPPCSLSDSEAMGTGLVSEASLVAEGDVVALFKPGVDVDLRTAACSAYAINTTSGGAKIPADVLAYGKPDRHGLNASLANDHAFDPEAWTRTMLAWTLGRLEADVWAELHLHYDTAKNNTAIACVESGNQGMELHTLIARRRIPRGEAVSTSYGVTYWLLHMARHSPNRPAAAFAALELLHGEGADPSKGYADFGVLHDTVWMHKVGVLVALSPFSVPSPSFLLYPSLLPPSLRPGLQFFFDGLARQRMFAEVLTRPAADRRNPCGRPAHRVGVKGEPARIARLSLSRARRRAPPQHRGRRHVAPEQDRAHRGQHAWGAQARPR